MFILLSDVFTSEGRRLETEAELEMTAFDNGADCFAIVDKTSVHFVITHLEADKALVEADIQLTISAVCDRCLTEVPVKLDLHAEQTVYSPDWTSGEDVEDQAFLDGYELDVEAFVHDMIIGNWPVKILCREDCKGICPACGQNRNVRDCGCDSFVPDPRMAVIQDIFNANKEV